MCAGRPRAVCGMQFETLGQPLMQSREPEAVVRAGDDVRNGRFFPPTPQTPRPPYRRANIHKNRNSYQSLTAVAATNRAGKWMALRIWIFRPSSGIRRAFSKQFCAAPFVYDPPCCWDSRSC